MVLYYRNITIITMPLRAGMRPSPTQDLSVTFVKRRKRPAISDGRNRNQERGLSATETPRPPNGRRRESPLGLSRHAGQRGQVAWLTSRSRTKSIFVARSPGHVSVAATGGVSATTRP